MSVTAAGVGAGTAGATAASPDTTVAIPAASASPAPPRACAPRPDRPITAGLRPPATRPGWRPGRAAGRPGHRSPAGHGTRWPARGRADRPAAPGRSVVARAPPDPAAPRYAA